jgi:hypothetical protein
MIVEGQVVHGAAEFAPLSPPLLPAARSADGAGARTLRRPTRYVKPGNTGLDVSPIAIGAMTFGEPGRGYPDRSLGKDDSE